MEKPLNPKSGEIPKEVQIDFVRLACALSPENLSCDGELSRSETQRKYRSLIREWRKLESVVGRKVEEGEVWKWTE